MFVFMGLFSGTHFQKLAISVNHASEWTKRSPSLDEIVVV